MRAADMHGVGDIRFEDVDVPRPRPGELLVEVATVGICGTDAAEFGREPRMFPIHERHPVTGHQGPMIPGHEFSGRVAELGEGVSGFTAGDLIVSGAGVSCGVCMRCRQGRTNLCAVYSTVGLQRHGALAEFVTVPASSCLNLRGRSISPDVAALGQPMAIAVHAARRGDPEPGSRACIIGAGGIGAFIAHAVTRMGGQITITDLRADRLTVARSLGATEVVEASPDSPLDEQLVGPFDLVYECTGTPSSLKSALALVPPGGRVVAVGIPKGDIAINGNSLVLQEKELIGTLALVVGTDLPTAMGYLEDAPDLWPSVAPDVLPLEALINEGLAPMLEGRQTRIKTLLSPGAVVTRPMENKGGWV